MSEPVCPKPAPCPTCTRVMHVLVLYCGAVLVLAVAMLGCVIADDRGSSSDLKPVPSTQAPANPSSEPPRPTPSPTAPMPSDPTGGDCNIFDPECSSGITGGIAG
ncbi:MULTISPECIES: hypothetical protein [Streptomyces]|uniref:Serine/threonine protein kinase n=1 Tax=Streptomyces galilaeus TaxID=33899 RepID=A0ABW9IN78_STRGJ